MNQSTDGRQFVNVLSMGASTQLTIGGADRMKMHSVLGILGDGACFTDAEQRARFLQRFVVACLRYRGDGPARTRSLP